MRYSYIGWGPHFNKIHYSAHTLNHCQRMFVLLAAFIKAASSSTAKTCHLLCFGSLARSVLSVITASADTRAHQRRSIVE